MKDKQAPSKLKRTYDSSSRQRQAEETRERIAAAAEKLLLANGSTGVTFESVALESGVALPTVYSNFKSKAALISAVIDRARFGEKYQEALKVTLSAADPRDQLKNASHIAASVYEPEDKMLELMSRAGSALPELSQFNSVLEQHRYDAQKMVILNLAEKKYLRIELSIDAARDIMWTLTSRDVYRMLVKSRGWSIEQYQKWLSETLMASLVRQDDE